jgi:hypothetical protein
MRIHARLAALKLAVAVNHDGPLQLIVASAGKAMADFVVDGIEFDVSLVSDSGTPTLKVLLVKPGEKDKPTKQELIRLVLSPPLIGESLGGAKLATFSIEAFRKPEPTGDGVPCGGAAAQIDLSLFGVPLNGDRII